jgi:uncharacterized protein (DUF2147 family)
MLTLAMELMRKIIFAVLLLINVVFAAQLEGFYKTFDETTGNAKSIVRLYKCGDNLCGRIVALYDEKGKRIEETLSAPYSVADKIKGKPKMAGLDIIWNMKLNPKENEYSGGKILDPKSGNIYSGVVWQDKKDARQLRVQGKIGPIGRTQQWQVMNVNSLPADLKNLDVSKWIPKIVQ